VGSSPTAAIRIEFACRCVSGFASLPLVAALQFLTILPPLIRRPFTPRELGQATGFYPVVGLIIGCILWGISEGLASIWPAPINDALILAAWVLITGALHLDGFLDACDGIFGGRTPEDRLRIMRDEHVGAFAVIGGVLLLLAKYAAMISVPDRRAALVLAPALGRCGMVLAIAFFPYARPEGLGRAIKDHSGWRQVLMATVVTGAACWLLGAELGLIALAVAGGAALAIGRFAMTRLSGLTGDIYGAVCEIIEVCVLLVFAARMAP
jgi:adenosylcobinamide-GDP ribazoletransferase